MPVSYQYPLSAFLNYAMNSFRLRREIEASPIVTQLAADPSLTLIEGEYVAILTFKADLSADDQATLGALVGAHSGAPLPRTQKTADGVVLVQPQVQTQNWQLCDRDIKIVTCTVDAATAVEDLKINLATLQEEPWDECALVGVYKDGGEGSNVPVDDQADADTNGVLSVFEYKALKQNANPKTAIPWEIRDGGIITDPAIPANERFSHKLYAVGAPDLAPLGYAVRFFDGYASAQPDNRIESKSPQAKRLDPIVPGANVMRFYLFHPAGAVRSHIIRIVTYRELGTV